MDGEHNGVVVMEIYSKCIMQCDFHFWYNVIRPSLIEYRFSDVCGTAWTELMYSWCCCCFYSPLLGSGLACPGRAGCNGMSHIP